MHDERRQTSGSEQGPEQRAEAADVMPVAGRDSLRWLWLVAFVLLLDQATKLLVVDNFQLYQRINMLPFFDLVRLHNTGAAFSLFAEASGWQRWFFTGLAAVISVVILWWQWNLPRERHRLLSLGLALVLAGALGNVIDRMLYGYVIDFLLFYIGPYAWPAFNVADSAICVGVTFVLYDHLFLEKKRGGRRADDRDVQNRRATDDAGQNRRAADRD
jgi:signal peptidase II